MAQPDQQLPHLTNHHGLHSAKSLKRLSAFGLLVEVIAMFSNPSVNPALAQLLQIGASS
jgi:hypothetical protein